MIFKVFKHGFINMKMKLMKSQKYLQQKFHESTCATNYSRFYVEGQ